MKVIKPEDISGTEEFGGVVKQALSMNDAELSCGTLLLKPGEVMKDFESHGSDEIFYISSGELTVQGKQGQSIAAKAGEIVYLPKGEWHLSSNTGNTDTVLFWVNRD